MYPFSKLFCAILLLAIILTAVMAFAENHLELNKMKRLCMEGGLAAVYAVIHLNGILHHEIWRDEAQAWLIARNTTMAELVCQLKAEGHPILWFLLLKPFAKLGCPVWILGVISLTLMTLAVCLMLHFSPFPYWLKTILLFGTAFFYLSPVVSRVYSLVTVLIIALAVVYPMRMKKPLLYGILTALLLQTHVIIAGFALMVWIMYCFGLLKTEKSEKTVYHWLGAFLPGISTVLLVLELMGNGRTSAGKITDNITGDFGGAVVKLLKEFPSCLGQAIGQEIPVGLFYLIAGTLLLLCMILWKKYWEELLIVLGAVGAQLLINVFIYATIMFRAVLMLVTLLFFLWQCMEKSKGKEISKVDRIYLTGVMLAVACLSIASVPFAFRNYAEDYRYAWSGGKGVADYIEKHLPDNSIIVSNLSGADVSVGAYHKGLRFWDPSSDSFYSYADWLDKDFDICREYMDIKGRIERRFPMEENVYLLINNAYVPGDLDAEELGLLYETGSTMIADENFSLYELKWRE
ncbi:MAG: hypothetical protein HFJ04_12290 [Lachnospiraceae bacterium]|nr:hypothetical protein [Lachnospiraceae bacterium]